MGGGKGGGGSNPGVSPYEAQQAAIASQLFGESTPIRQNLISQLGSFTTGGAIPTLLNPVYDVGKSAIEQQYNVAKQNLIASSPRGGSMADVLASLEANRASDLGTLRSGIASDLFNRAFGVAFQTPSVALQGLGSAGSSYATRAQAETAAEANKVAAKYGMIGNLGLGTGRLLGSRDVR